MSTTLSLLFKISFYIKYYNINYIKIFSSKKKFSNTEFPTTFGLKQVCSAVLLNKFDIFTN